MLYNLSLFLILMRNSKRKRRLSKKIKLPPPVAAIYRAVEELQAKYPPRKFTPDGHLVGSIGEVVAAEILGLTLYPMSRAGHDANDANGDVQIKLTAGESEQCTRNAFGWWYYVSSLRRKRRLFMMVPAYLLGLMPAKSRRMAKEL
jgi:hypothetical protein